MILRVSKFAAATGLAVFLACVAGCSAPEPENAPPPPPPPQAYERSAADLAGGPPAAPPRLYEDGLAGGLAYGDRAPPVTAMAPIANPEDLSTEDRHRIYGDRYDAPRSTHRRPAERAEWRASAPHPTMKTAPAKSKTAVAAAPAAAKPVKAAPAATTAAPAAPTLTPPLAKLQTAVGARISSVSTLTVDPALAQRVQGPVTLTLPQNLFEVIGEEAAKLGLGRAARSVEVTATLSGSGYEITPGGPQTAKLKPGQPPFFQWQVNPGAGQLGALKADVEAKLTGQGKVRTLPLISVKQPTPAAATPVASAKRAVGWQTLVGGGMVLLAILLMAALARNASETKARARQKRAREREQTELAEQATASAKSAKPAVARETPDKP